MTAATGNRRRNIIDQQDHAGIIPFICMVFHSIYGAQYQQKFCMEVNIMNLKAKIIVAVSSVSALAALGAAGAYLISKNNRWKQDMQL